jgi:hypothetical protein
VRIADYEFSPDQAFELLQGYAVKYPDTVRLYDLAGDPGGRPGPGSGADPVNAVTLADIGRLTVINANLRANDVATLVDIHAAVEFAAVPATSRLEQCEPGSASYQAATALYEKYRPPKGSNIGPAKRSKLLHLKRPWLIPIADSRVVVAYRRRARSWAAGLGQVSARWEPIREDLTAAAEDFERLTARLCDHQDPRVQRLGRLTSLRLLDILAWRGDS